ncbi:MAG TPA: glycerol-3-phosphate 1-O-acyltransferase PlsY [Kiritimatiellia bacterium]|jgi:glycerol-3-phosphate acyltransferase PlsY|nr:glycerol-3-phosphate 1-O-acyltransferase PlsY [Kiritimatiellia bacterium]HOM58571.1 glycerol-3-phosphate 1-O-acyltransferase PlsY [Kiritimatiellia bacterium]HOR97151.1 glycerol-3-phosphate 1-O-acyltransferase PlsY [Kiritimatiellia bacterium]HPC48656.1 glycerol-3-phosphate 1-O-acyltransferase PlsY [Kiritimatiellia bacterium]HPK37924.1 glycerol-3-phosphate 1-O-acyltransferase PlsY [Kiritimatiellia bacterium]
MTTVTVWIVGGVAAYLLGSIPFGFLLARSRGKDIRTLGSGNIGATNVFRSVSKPLGVLTFALDFLKGLGGVTLIPALALTICPPETGAAGGKGLAMFCGALTVVGHNWTCFLRFKGGKGVATSTGLVLGLAPQAVGIAFVVWLVVFLMTRMVSAASVAAAVTLAAAVWWPLRLHAAYGFWFPAVFTALAAVAVWKHRSNLARIRNGTEARFTFRTRRQV